MIKNDYLKDILSEFNGMNLSIDLDMVEDLNEIKEVLETANNSIIKRRGLEKNSTVFAYLLRIKILVEKNAEEKIYKLSKLLDGNLDNISFIAKKPKISIGKIFLNRVLAFLTIDGFCLTDLEVILSQGNESVSISLENSKEFDIYKLKLGNKLRSIKFKNIKNLFATKPVTLEDVFIDNCNFDDFDRLRVNKKLALSEFNDKNGNLDVASCIAQSGEFTLFDSRISKALIEALKKKNVDIDYCGFNRIIDGKKTEYCVDHSSLKLTSYKVGELEEILKDNSNINLVEYSPKMTKRQLERIGRLKNIKNIKNIKFYYGESYNDECQADFETVLKAEKIFDNILSSIPDGLDEYERAKKIYCEIGKRVSYDINVTEEATELSKEDMEKISIEDFEGGFQYEGDKYDEYLVYEKANENTRNIFTSIISGKGVCTSFANIYKFLCERAGIKCETLTTEKHMYNKIFVGKTDELMRILFGDIRVDKMEFYCDLTQDARNIKNYRPCYYFGKTDENDFGKRSDEYETDKKIGYFDGYKENNYSDRVWAEMLKKMNLKMSLNETVNYILNNILSEHDFSKNSNIEVMSITRILIQSALKMSNCNKEDSVSFIECFAKSEKNKEPRGIIAVRDDQSEEYKYYTYHRPKNKFLKIEKDVLEEMLSNGILGVYYGKKIPGIDIEWRAKGLIER